MKCLCVQALELSGKGRGRIGRRIGIGVREQRNGNAYGHEEKTKENGSENFSPAILERHTRGNKMGE
jgi:hypothetical protein